MLGVVFFALLGGGFFVARIALGPLALNGLAPQIAKALDERFGHRYEFGFGGTAIVRNGYAPALSIDKLSVKEPSGRTILTAPRAEVSVDLFALCFGRVTPRRLEIFDVEVHLTLRPDGSLVLPVASDSGQAVAVTPPLTPALGLDSQSQPLDMGTKNPATPALTAKPPRALIVKQMAASIRLVIDTLTNPANPAAAIDRIGITRGKLVIDDQTAGQTMVFDGVNLGFDKSSGATKFNLSVEGPNGRWLASGVAGGMPGSERGLTLSVSNLSLDEILLAAGTRTIGADFDMPLSGKLNFHLLADGTLSEAAGQFELGAGYMRFDDPDDEPMMIDKITGGFHWDSAARRIAVDRWQLAAGASHFAVSGFVTPPHREGDPWSLALTNAEPNVAGPQRPGEKPIVIDQTALAARLYLAEKKLVIDRFVFGGPGGAIAMAGGIDWFDGPHLRLGASISPAPVSTILRMWPSFVASPVRAYLLARTSDGTVEKGTLQIDFDGSDLQAMRAGRPPPDAKVLLDFTVANASLEFLPGVPPLRGIDGTGHVTGKSASFAVTNAALDAGSGRMLTVSDGSFHVADFEVKPTPAVVEAKVTGSVEAIGELLSHDALKPYASLLVNSSTLGGQVGGNLEIDMKLGPNTSPADTTLKVNATVTNFTAERLIGNEKFDAATLTVTVDPSGHRATGQGTIFGAPATISIESMTGKPGEVSIGLTLDDAIRARQGFGAIPGVNGPIGAKITAPIGAEAKFKARIELDLSRAAIDIPGISKPAGQPGKVAFLLAVNDEGTLLDQIAVDAGPIQARGNVQLGAGLALIAAKFPQVKLSAGDDMKIDAFKTGETMKVVARGTAIDARPFLQSLIFKPPANDDARQSSSGARTEAGPFKEIEFDVKTDILSGYNKQIIAGAELRFAKRGDEIKQFTFAGTFGQQPISCNLTGADASPQLNLVSEDAGSLLLFLDLYKHMEHGRLSVGMRLGPDSLVGALRIDDFVLRDEPALRRLVAEGAPPLDTPGKVQKIDASAVAFNRLQVRFRRDGTRLDLSAGTMHGEAIGLTVDGAVDFVHDQVDMRGTFVPVYAFNNLFAKIPVVGLILGGATDEGLIGVNYRISGLASAPTLTINPLSAITPGIFRQIFGVVDFDPMHPQQ